MLISCVAVTSLVFFMLNIDQCGKDITRVVCLIGIQMITHHEFVVTQ